MAFVGLCSAACAQPAVDFRWQDRLDHYVHRTYSWQRMTMLGGETAFEHLLNRDAHAFGYRYSSALGERMVRNTIELGLGAALHEDTRLRPSRQEGFGKRLRHALMQTVMISDSRGDSFAWSRLGAKAGAALIGSRWRPHRTSAPHVFEEIGSGCLSDLQNSLLSEFGDDLKRWGRKMRWRIFR